MNIQSWLVKLIQMLYLNYNFKLLSDIIILFICTLPHLKDIIISTWSQHESFIEVPAKVWHSISMSTMHKEQLWWSISLLFFCLWLIETREIPYHDPAVMAWGGQEVALHWRKSDIVYVFCVPTEAEELSLYVSHVPDSHSAICWTSYHQILIKWRAINAHNFLNMAFYWARWPLWVSEIPDLKLLIITNSWEYELIKVVPSYIFYDWAMCLLIEHWILVKLIWICLINIPDTYSAIVWTR